MDDETPGQPTRISRFSFWTRLPDLEERPPIVWPRCKALGQRCKDWLCSDPGEPWWREHRAAAATVVATALTGYAVILSRRYTGAAGVPSSAWRIEPTVFISMLAFYIGGVTAVLIGIPMLLRRVYAATFLRAALDEKRRRRNRKRAQDCAQLLLVSALGWITLGPPPAETLLGFYAATLMVAVVVSLTPGRVPRLIGSGWLMVIVCWTGIGMWVSAAAAGNDHAAGRPGNSVFSRMFVVPSTGKVDGDCVLRIDAQLYIAADGDPTDNLNDGDVDIDSGGPFTLGCPQP